MIPITCAKGAAPIGENIEIDWRPEPNLWKVKLDPCQMEQVLVNLTVNARDAILGGGQLTIETRNEFLDADYCGTHVEFIAGEYVMISVRDKGSGMPKEVLDHIFEPFYTTKAFGKGTGLGLAIVYGIVKQNNGVILVDSEPGQGTIFRIYLPRAVGTATKSVSEPEQPRSGGWETILMVEDEEAILGLGRTVLQAVGYRVLTARTPAEGLRMAKEARGSVHLLLTDVMLPGMNGKELKARISELWPNIRVLFISGYTSDVIGHQGVLEEGISFLQKPFSRNTLIAKVREVLDEERAESSGRPGSTPPGVGV